jgi:2-polyprenyl-3-methyl-5-hydroxy-6-metoxy-1,4-benzoquinol methylase
MSPARGLRAALKEGWRESSRSGFMTNRANKTDAGAPSRSIHESEQEYFDHLVGDSLEGLKKEDWLVDPAAHRATLKMWGLDSDLSGKKILDCGCGTGFFSVLLAKMGADVWSFDLSPKSVELTMKRADLNGVRDRVNPKVASFENVDFEDESFDLVVGKNILHHIPDISDAGRQIRRKLKNGGKAIFYELSASNPILMFFRDHVIGKSSAVPKLGTPDEHPLTADEIEALSVVFNHQCKVSFPKFRFFGKLDRQVFRRRYRFLSFLMEAIDNMIYTFLPPLRKYSYKIMLEFTK